MKSRKGIEIMWGTYESEAAKTLKAKQKIFNAMENWETDGYRNGDPVFCPVNAYGDCPYCDQCNLCHIADPIKECDDFGAFYESWDDWLNADDIDPDSPLNFAEDEIRWAGDVYGYEDTMEENEE